MTNYSWHKTGSGVILGTKTIGFAQAMPPEIKPKPKQATTEWVDLGLKQDPYE